MSEEVDTLKAALTEWLGTLGTIAVVVSAGLALLYLLVLIARRRSEIIGRRDAELAEATHAEAMLAESTLAAFYEARDNLTWVRLGSSSGDDSTSLPGAYYTVLERLKDQSEFWGRFLASRHRFRALFGDTSTKPFTDIRQVRHDVIGAAQKLIELYKSMPDNAAQDSREQIEKLESVVWRRNSQDALEARITGAVRAMEDFCRSVIAGHRRRSRRRSSSYRAHRRHAVRPL